MIEGPCTSSGTVIMSMAEYEQLLAHKGNSYTTTAPTVTTGTTISAGNLNSKMCIIDSEASKHFCANPREFSVFVQHRPPHVKLMIIFPLLLEKETSL